jgi:two-component system chemotaxis response regulator CheB
MEPGKPVRLLIVDDSAFARMALIRRLTAAGGIEVAGTAANGQEAVQQVKSLRPDVVTMDVNMPVMDGLAAVEQIIRECPTPVVMLSSHTGEGTESTIRALELGAVDFFLKPALSSSAGEDPEIQQIREKIIHAAGVPRASLRPGAFRTARPQQPSAAAPAKDFQLVIVMASSTGGPKALLEMMPDLPASLPASILIVQHMPQGFTQSLAELLNACGTFRVTEAKSGDQLAAGRGYVAPGGQHLVVRPGGRLEVNEGPPIMGLRPAADLTMESAAAVYGRKTAGVILTGMGTDGTRGAKAIRAAGGVVIAQHESSCVVYGMPKSVIEAGLASQVAALPDLARSIVALHAAVPAGR